MLRSVVHVERMTSARVLRSRLTIALFTIAGREQVKCVSPGGWIKK